MSFDSPWNHRRTVCKCIYSGSEDGCNGTSHRYLAVGHREELEGIWQNPALYPQMFPWLFPYGLGGIGGQRHKGTISDAAHKRHLLMYHDKRFQMDHEFCLIAFNHEQIKDATTSGFLMTERIILTMLLRDL